jgi:peptide/nickel transport system permease protein
MITFILRRVASGLIVLAAVTTMTFFLLYLSTANVARNILGETATAAQVHQKEIQLGLDKPLVDRYFDWVGGALRGDFGVSWFGSQPVAHSIITRLPATISVVVVTILVVAVISTVLGVTAAVRRGRTDATLQIVSVGGAAIPQFVAAIVIVTVFAIKLRLFPATGYVNLGDDPAAWLRSIALPVAALAIAAIASTTAQVRSSTIAVLEKDYVRTLRSRGLGEGEILFKHVLRDAAPAALTVLSLQFIAMLGGVVIIEQIFALPGVGFLALQSTTQGDMPMLMGVVTYIVIVVVVVNLLADLAVGWLNPKARVR